MQFSVIISTKNRAGYLKTTLSKFEEVNYHGEWEIIVINNTSTDSTDTVLSEFSSRSELNLKCLQENRPGKSRALNKAIEKAAGSILLFTDDDCYPAGNYFSQWEKVFTEDQEIGFAGGRILLFDDSDLPLTIQKSTRRIIFKPNTLIRTGQIQGANLAIKKQVVKHVNGFDTSLGPGTPFISEDVDIVSRASIAGIKGVYDPRPVIYHHHRVKTHKQAAQKNRGYDIGRGAYYLKCMRSDGLRSETTRLWLSKLRSQPLKKSGREVRGAVWYLGVLFKKRLLSDTR